MRSRALNSLAFGYWRKGEIARAEAMLLDDLQLAQLTGDQWLGAQCLQVLGWIAEARQAPRRAATLLAAASALCRATGADSLTFAHAGGFHEECERRLRNQLDPAAYSAASIEGRALNFKTAAVYALSTSG